LCLCLSFLALQLDDAKILSALQQHWVGDKHAPIKRRAVSVMLGVHKPIVALVDGALPFTALGDALKDLKPHAKLSSVFPATDADFEVQGKNSGKQIRLTPVFCARILDQLKKSAPAVLPASKHTRHTVAQQAPAAGTSSSSSSNNNIGTNPVLNPKKSSPPLAASKPATAAAASKPTTLPACPPPPSTPKPPLVRQQQQHKSSSAAGSTPQQQASLPIKLIHTCGSPEHAQLLHHLRKCTEIAIDCEWAPQQHGRDVCLVQICAPCAHDTAAAGPPTKPSSTIPAAVYLVDPVAAAAAHGVAGGVDLLLSLAPMLQSPTTLKVFHDCREVGAFFGAFFLLVQVKLVLQGSECTSICPVRAFL